jgi:hypothetical protein
MSCHRLDRSLESRWDSISRRQYQASIHARRRVRRTRSRRTSGRPVRLKSWAQFASIYGDPNEPDNGPFIAGANLAHAVCGFFANGGRACLVVRVSPGPDAEHQATVPAAADPRVDAFRVVAPSGATEEISVDVEPGSDVLTYRPTVTAGDQKEEYDGLSLVRVPHPVRARRREMSPCVFGGAPGAAHATPTGR